MAEVVLGPKHWETAGNKALRAEVERLQRTVAAAESNYETLNAQARKSRLVVALSVYRQIMSHDVISRRK